MHLDINTELRYFNDLLFSLSDKERELALRIANDPFEFVRFHNILKEGKRLKISERQIRELTELGYILYFKRNINKGYKWVVNQYQKLPTITLRTSTVVDLQQYSTPPPIAYLFGQFADKDPVNAFDPTAGNGMLFLNLYPTNTYANEIDLFRLKNLKYQHFETSYYDAYADSFPKEWNKKMDIVVTNPPFGSIPEIKFDSYKITSLEHYIVIEALKTMKDTGKACIIVGGNVEYDNNGIITPGKFRQFLFYLYSKYNVVDVINCSGDLYYKMGTSFPITIILIHGITDNPKYPPRADFDLATATRNSPNQVKYFEALEGRFNEHTE